MILEVILFTYFSCVYSIKSNIKSLLVYCESTPDNRNRNVGVCNK